MAEVFSAGAHSFLLATVLEENVPVFPEGLYWARLVARVRLKYQIAAAMFEVGHDDAQVHRQPYNGTGYRCRARGCSGYRDLVGM